MASDTVVDTGQLDKYATDAQAWREFAEINYAASALLFGSDGPFLWFAAATLGHQALEMFLKAALICEGMTVFNPQKISKTSPMVTFKPEDCVWGHNLLDLARTLGRKRPEFNLSVMIRTPYYFAAESGFLTVERGFEIFDPFFYELRYPTELTNVECLGPEHKIILEELVTRLRPFGSTNRSVRQTYS
jgi:HEPN domain-containing protein